MGTRRGIPNQAVLRNDQSVYPAYMGGRTGHMLFLCFDETLPHPGLDVYCHVRFVSHQPGTQLLHRSSLCDAARRGRGMAGELARDATRTNTSTWIWRFMGSVGDRRCDLLCDGQTDRAN